MATRNVTILTTQGAHKFTIETTKSRIATARRVCEMFSLTIGREMDRSQYARIISRVMSTDAAWFNVEVS